MTGNEVEMDYNCSYMQEQDYYGENCKWRDRNICTYFQNNFKDRITKEQCNFTNDCIKTECPIVNPNIVSLFTTMYPTLTNKEV